MSRLVRRLFTRVFDTRRSPRPARRASELRARLLLLPLEKRVVPATFTVTNTADTLTTTDPNFAGSLRGAIAAANATAGADIINFSPSTFNTFQAIFLNTGQQLTISDAVTINGPGINNVVISGNGGTRVFNITDGTTTKVVVNLSGMRVTGGRIDTTGVSTVTAGDGAGIFISNENVTLDGMVVESNIINGAPTDGGAGVGVAAGGLLTVRNSTISGNSTNGRGGGLYFLNGGALLMENSTVSGNTSAPLNGGGGLYFYGAVLTTGPVTGLTVRNSTISGNGATFGSGGGIALRALNGTLLVQNSTITGNTAGTVDTGAGFGGGGIVLETLSATVGAVGTITVQSSIVSGNAAPGAGTPDISAILNPAVTVNVDHSAIGSGNGFTASETSFANLPFGTNLGLQALAANGGPTQTHLVASTSAAVDHGSNPASLTTDQRGTGFARGSGLPDIGAAESANANLPVAGLGPIATVTSNGATTFTFTVVYDDVTAVKVSTLDGNDVRVTGPASFNVLASFVSVDTNTDGKPRTATYRITPPGGSWDAADLGTYAVVMQAGQVTNTATTPAAVAAGPIGSFQALTPQTFTVTSTADTTAAGTLRAAIASANARLSTNDVIAFDSTFGGSNPARTVTLGSQITISDPLTFTGPGATKLTVNGGGGRAFNVNDGTGGIIPVTLSGMTITGGTGVISNENTTLDSVVVTGNSSAGVTVSASSTVTVLNSTISANTNPGVGGGIDVRQEGNLVVRNSTISGNSATGAGGAIYFQFNGSLLVENSTISGNATSAPTLGGGGIYFYGTVRAGGLTVRNSTITGNTASAGNGGGISLVTFTGNLVVQNSTITGNSAGNTTAGAGAGGGGISKTSTGGTITVTSSIVSGNTAALGGAATDIAAAGTTTVTATNSAIGVDPGVLNAASANNLIGANLQLQPLGNNGGPTQTIALGSTSAALDKGSNPASLATDQRGTGFVRVSGAAADIGAFEFQTTSGVAPTVVGAPRINNGAAQRSMVTTMSVTFSTVVTFAGTVASAFTLTRIGGGAVTIGSATAATVSGATVVTLTGFSGAEASSGGSLNDGRYTLTALATQITANGQQLNGGGTPGTNFVYGDSGAATGNQLFRFFGDVNGDRFNNGADFALFRTAFGTQSPDPNYNAAFDANGDGFVNGADFTPFRTNFGGSI